MSATLAPSDESGPSMPPATPEATTSAILANSHNGWSPLRVSKRSMGTRPDVASPTDELPSDVVDADASPATRRKVSNSFAHLRAHGLVSNSIFKQHTGDSQSDMSVSPSKLSGFRAPAGRTPNAMPGGMTRSASKMGIGLGIGVDSASPSKIPIPRPPSSGSGFTPRRASAERTPSHSRQHSNAENEAPGLLSEHDSAKPPRKSSGFQHLQKASYVSNSPFRQTAAPAAKPLRPQNAWAATAEARANAASSHGRSSSEAKSTFDPEESSQSVDSPPHTPTEEKSSMDYTSPPHTPQRHSAPQSAQSSPGGLDSTPRSQRHSRSQSSSSDSGRGGLLVSNRLHGPRVMTPDRPTLDGVVGEESWAGRGSARRERRKTVTFDEVLDVQEFEKDSSFERESERSDASSMHSSGSGQGFDGEVDEEYDEEEAMWTREDELADREDAQRNDRLVVVNGSPYNSTPSSMDESDRFEPDEHEGGSETDSRDISSSDEPASPPQGPTMQLPIDDVSFDKSFDKSYATALNTSFDASFEEAGGLSFASLGAADRVDDMVDQLLREDILSSPTPQAGPTMGLSQPHRKSASPSTPIDALVGESPSGSHVQQADSPAHVTVDGEMEDPFTTPETLANTATHLPMQRPSPARSMQASIHSKMGSDECDHARNLQDGPEDEGSPSASRRPLPHLPPADEEGPSTSNTLAPPREGQHGDGLPTLPNWSPLVFDEAPLPDENEHDGAAQAASHHQSATRDVKLDEFGSASPNAKTGSVSGARRTPSARGRPHISRDAVLERVAREKRLANAGAQNGGQSSSAAGEQGMNASHTHSEIMSNHGTRGRASESAVAMAKSASEGVNASTSHAVPRPSMPARANTGGNRVEARAAAQPSPLKQTFENLESPLDRLGAEVAKRGSMDSGEGERRDGWFDRSRETSVEPSAPGPEPASASKLSPSSVSAALPANNTLRPPSSADQDAGPSSGRLSPSTLGAPPPPVSPAQRELQIIARRRSKNGRSGPGMRKRSLSTGDANPPLRRASAGSGGPGAEGGSAEEGDSPVDEEEEEEEEGPAARKNVEADLASSKLLLDLSVQKALESGFGHGVEREISRIYKEGERKYKVMDRGTFMGVDDKVTHSTRAGDVDSGKAWRKLRRPSDMNEYAKEIREYRENENPKKAAGKVFVMVDTFTPADLPVPMKPTFFHCILDNGLHMVKTGTAPLRAGGVASKIGQEFELIQHKNLAFSLTLVAQRDAHLVEPRPVPATTPRPAKISPVMPKVSRFFSSPKKAAKKASREQLEREAATPPPQQRLEPMLMFINREGAFGRAGVTFESVAEQCTARCLVLDLPVQGVADPMPSMPGAPSLNSMSANTMSRRAAEFARNLERPRGTLRLKLFYLPPLPSVPRNLLPENLNECIRGMQNAAWHHAEPWLEGTLTQLGGDCRSWRRRPIKAQGAHLICFNEITKRPTVKIDLSKAVSVEDNADPHTPSFTPGTSSASGSTPASSSDGRASRATARSAATMREEDADESYDVERSFRVTFADGERISFFADTDEQKDAWIEVLRGIVERKAPPCPLWAQLAFEMARSASGAPSVPRKQSILPQGAGPGAGRASNGALTRSATRESTRMMQRQSRNAPPTVEEEARTPERASQTATLPNPSSSAPRPSSMLRPANSFAPGSNGAGAHSPARKPVPGSQLPVAHQPHHPQPQQQQHPQMQATAPQPHHTELRRYQPARSPSTDALRDRARRHGAQSSQSGR